VKISRLAVAAALLTLAGACAPPPAARPTYAVTDRGADTDGDGAADKDDACPADPEDGLLPKANDGCPAADPDQDGVIAGDDQCPDAKEDQQAPSPADGCPLGDADKDGVADALDQCKDKAEDNEAPSPSDGCPAPDADGDLIVDAKDKCPAEPETINEYRDADGCPDQEPTTVVWDDESSAIFIPVAKRFHFGSDSSDLGPEGDATIAEIAKLLEEHPEIQRIEIEGHASTKGNESYNVALTERRAHVVGLALKNKKVDEKRLVPIGYGEHCPAVQTANEVDEPKNRRVLVKTVLVSGTWRDTPRGCWKAQTKGINPTKRKPGVAVPPKPQPLPPDPLPPSLPA
jgi:outer membrane protein OmpA-like peptidoglycan-associated protein